MATYVLVHGGWHGGWCWKRVAELLRAAGHEVHTPTLTGQGDRAHLSTKSLSMSTHIQDIVATIEFEGLDKVILVGHSYGGMPVIGTSNELPQRIAHLVLLDAIVPDDGQSFQSIYPEYFDYLKSTADATGAWQVPVPDNETFGVVDPEDVKWLRRNLTPGGSIRLLAEPITLTNPLAFEIPRTYILCNENGSRSGFASFLKEPLPANWTVREMDAAHDVMITNPKGLVEKLTTVR